MAWEESFTSGGQEIVEALKNSEYQVSGERFGRREGLPGLPSQSAKMPTAIEGTDGRLWFTVYNGIVWLDPARASHRLPPPPVTIQSVSADDQELSGRFTDSVACPHLQRADQLCGRKPFGPGGNSFPLQAARNGQGLARSSDIQLRELPQSTSRFSTISSSMPATRMDYGQTIPQQRSSLSYLPSIRQTGFVLLWSRLSFWRCGRRTACACISSRGNSTRRSKGASTSACGSRANCTIRCCRVFRGWFPFSKRRAICFLGEADRAAEVLDEGLHDAADAIVEGRNAIQGLRAIPSLDPDLGYLLKAAGQELAQSTEAEGSAPAFRVVVEGPRLPLVPLLRDEIYRIGREMLRNAFRHAHASRIEAEIRYDRDLFRLRIRDNGKGIDSNVLKEGARTGHLGLPGVHERAKKMGARLKIWSEPGAGTEVELTVPARIAYEKFSMSNGWWARLGRRSRPTAPKREA